MFDRLKMLASFKVTSSVFFAAVVFQTLLIPSTAIPKLLLYKITYLGKGNVQDGKFPKEMSAELLVVTTGADNNES